MGRVEGASHSHYLPLTAPHRLFDRLNQYLITTLVIIRNGHFVRIKCPFFHAAIGETLRHFQVVGFALVMKV
jgi:hypothetical protein